MTSVATEPAVRSQPRGPGRPRVEGHDERILAAVLRLIDADEAVTVTAVVAASGVSRAALYRRWSSMPDLIAAALDQGRAVPAVDVSGDIKQAIIRSMFERLPIARGEDYSEFRFRKRMALVMENPELQQAYWASHVKRRRGGMHRALTTAIARGQLRADLDVDACIDAINGVFYYQLVVRGTPFDDPESLARCRAAFEVIWRGMQAQP